MSKSGTPTRDHFTFQYCWTSLLHLRSRFLFIAEMVTISIITRGFMIPLPRVPTLTQHFGVGRKYRALIHQDIMLEGGIYFAE